MPRQPKTLELFGQEQDIGCCQPGEEAGLISEWTVLPGQGCELLLVVDIEDGQSFHMPYATGILMKTHCCPHDLGMCCL